MLNLEQIMSRFDPVSGEIADAPLLKRYLGALRGCFVDSTACENALAAGNPLVYTVSSFEPASGGGDLHYGLGRLLPGRIGEEYFMTKGHLHPRREAAEVYIGLSGEGVMLLEDEGTGESRMVPLRPHHAVYVPGHTAHRTVNTGAEPLTYLGIYPANSGHDYGGIAAGNFLCVVVDRNGQPAMIERKTLL